ncbi:ATP-binding protein [Maridesulfovibrio sp.]|uniref:hybrid sensor histidine kinase/response regulator n=1 Tax=Maridesulfovibrio sp. TaxID=2795000 RepID=UPI002AA74A38|nr:ATP-binding protein [Maridesulfovibrio sp.]
MAYLKKWWLTLCFILLTVILTAIIIIPHSTTSRNVLTGLSRDIMLNISAYTLDKSESYLQPAEKAAELTRFLADSNIVSSEQSAHMLRYFIEQLSLHQQFYGIYYGSTKGEFFMVARSEDKVKGGLLTKTVRIKDSGRITKKTWITPKMEEFENVIDPLDRYDPRKRPWFIDALINNDVIWTSPYIFFTSQKPGITTASPVYDKKGNLQGVVGVDITIDELSTFLGGLNIGKNGKAFIVDTSGNVVAFPDINALKQTTQNNKIRLSKITELPDPLCIKAYNSLRILPDRLPKAPVFTTFKHNGDRYNAVFTPFKNSHWPWIIGIYIPENDYLGEIKEDYMFSLITAALAVLLSGLIGWIVARKLDTAKKNAIAANHAKSQFMAVMSHEIRTPMNVILGTTDLLKHSNPSEEQKKYIKLLDDSGAGLLASINDILDMSKAEAGLLDLDNIELNPSEIIRQACTVFEVSAAQKEIELVCTFNDILPERVMGDPARFKQILLNLIGNAVKFTDSGGVYVQAGCTHLSNQMVELKIEIRDSGPGIPPERQKAIFDQFSRYDNSISRESMGIGLGLSISKKLCELMNGDISVTSIPGSGSTFIFTITMPETGAIPPAETKEAAKPENKKLPRKILLIEDNRSNRMLFEHFISDSPHIMKCAANGEEGVEIFKEFQPDIIFMDIEMPVMDGYKATSEIRDWEKIIGQPEIPIIALSAHAIKGTAEEARKSGCTSYMTKPVTKTQFLEKIEGEYNTDLN